MKFDDAINYIAESTLNSEMAREKNLAILARAAELEKKGLSPKTAKAYAYKELRAGKLGSTPSVATPTSAPEPKIGFKRSAEALRAKEQVADFLKYNSSATSEDVAAALDLDPELVASVYDDAKNEVEEPSAPADVNEPNENELKADIDDKMARIKAQILKLRKLKGKGKIKPSKPVKDIEDTDDLELEPNLDPDIKDYVSRTGGSVDQED